MKKVLFLLLFSQIAKAASDGHGGDFLNLIPSFINVTLLAGFLIWKVKGPLKNHFINKANEITKTMERANVKSKEAQIMLEQQEKKLANMENELTEIKEKTAKEIDSFQHKYSEDIELRKNKLKEDASHKVIAEKNAMLEDVNESLIDTIILKTKSSIKSNKNSQQMASTNLLKELQ